ncbi:MAG: tol-pal system protein YbgF [Rhodoferax sp.]|nr:tol-pal system protein YbgF [Rhodoferax sp.]
MKLRAICFSRRSWSVRLALALTAVLMSAGSQAALFEDDEARKAILDLRQRVEAVRTEAEQARQAARQAAAQDGASLSKGQLDLHSQIELLRGEISSLRGANEVLSKALSDLQLQLRSDAQTRQTLEQRLAQLEPTKVTVDGVEFTVEPGERREFEAALTVFRRGDFLAAQNLFVSFLGRYAGSGYAIPALFWLGNAQYATRDYKEAMINFRALIARSANHLRAPEAVLSVANCQLELKDAKGARKTLTDLIKAYPQSEAAAAAKERLAALK